MSRVKNLVRRNSNIPRWVPAALVVAAGIALLFFRGGDLGPVSSRPGDYHDDTGQGETRGNGESRDEEDEGGVITAEGYDEDEGSRGEKTELRQEMEEDDDYVVLTEAEIGPAIHSACSSPSFQQCCQTVRQGWDLLRPNRLESTCSRMYEIFRDIDPVAAALFGEHLTWEEQQRTFTIMMTTIISKSADPSVLEETLRPLGERHFARRVKDSYYESLGKAWMRALREALGEEGLPASATAAWEAFFATVSACMMIAGDGVAPRRHVALLGGARGASHGNGGQIAEGVCVGWTRDGDGKISYTVGRSHAPPPPQVAGGEKASPLKHLVGVGTEGGGGVLSS